MTTVTFFLLLLVVLLSTCGFGLLGYLTGRNTGPRWYLITAFALACAGTAVTIAVEHHWAGSVPIISWALGVLLGLFARAIRQSKAK